MTDTNGDPTAGNGGGSGDGDNGRGNNKGGNGNQTVSLKGMTKAERKAYKKRVKEEAAAKREVKVSKYVKAKKKGAARRQRQKVTGKKGGDPTGGGEAVTLNTEEEARLADQLEVAEKSLAQFAKKDVKKGVRQTGKVERSARATTDQVIDQHTMRVLFKWMADGYLEEMGGAIRSGKEASAFHARGNVVRMRSSGGMKGKDMRAGVEHILAMREQQKREAAGGGGGGGAGAGAGEQKEDEVAEVRDGEGCKVGRLVGRLIRPGCMLQNLVEWGGWVCLLYTSPSPRDRG